MPLRPIATFDDGPFVRENWLHFEASEPPTSIIEVPLYSDARITGERSFGPYTLLNYVPETERFGQLRPILLLRYSWHVPAGRPGFAHVGTNDERYHGGNLPDEIAALVSLCLGVRLWAGKDTRWFEPDGDRFGRVRHDEKPPSLTVLDGAARIPSAVAPASLGRADPVASVPRLSSLASNVLIRVARSYQRALWLADADPTQAWLHLVSAIEAATNHWSSDRLDAVQVLREHKPKLCDALLACGGPQAILHVAQEFAQQMRATAKFIRFMKHHCPGAPPHRPHPVAQHSWTPEGLESSFRTIYRYRSVALHGGRPFPLPMCTVPFRHHEWQAPEEVITSEKVGASGGEWSKKSIPMLLHVFEYVTREAIHMWWKGIGTGSAQLESATDEMEAAPETLIR